MPLYSLSLARVARMHPGSRQFNVVCELTIRLPLVFVCLSVCLPLDFVQSHLMLHNVQRTNPFPSQQKEH